MSRPRLYVAIAVMALFVILGAAVTFMNTGGGGTQRTIDASVVGGTMTPSALSARQGDRLTVNITADSGDEIHLHGYDIHFEGKAGAVRSRTFKADRSGTFELEYEKSGVHLADLTVSP